MRQGVAGVAVVVALAAPGGAAAAAAERCQPPESETILENQWGRIFSTPPYDARYACSFETGRRESFSYDEASSSGTYEAGPFALAGRVAAYFSQLCPRDSQTCFTGFVRSFDLRDGRTRRRFDYDGRVQVRQIVTRSNGSMAWIYERFVDPSKGHRVALRRSDRRGAAVLASGYGDSAPQSLALTGSTLRWRQDGVERSKTLR